MKRAALAIGGVLLVVLAAIGIYVYVQLDWLIKRAIEGYGGDILQAKVEVGDVELSPQNGQGRIGELRVGNPSGFNSEHAFTADSIELAVNPTSLTSDVIYIKKIVIDRPSLTYEQSGKGSNFDALKRNIARHIGDRSREQRNKETKLIVEELRIRGAKVQYLPTIPTAGVDLSFVLADIHLRNLGKKRGGLTPAELTQILVNTLLERTVAEIGRTTVPSLLDRLFGP
jgi:hypothetical protein